MLKFKKHENPSGSRVISWGDVINAAGNILILAGNLPTFLLSHEKLIRENKMNMPSSKDTDKKPASDLPAEAPEKEPDTVPTDPPDTAPDKEPSDTPITEEPD